MMDGHTERSDVRAVLFDIDGTLTTGGEVWGVLLRSPHLARLRKMRLYAAALPHYGLSRAGLVGQAGFRDRWVRLMAGLMTGWPASQVQAVYTRAVQDYLVPILRPDVVALLKQHKARGHRVVLVSTIFEGIVGELADYLDADAGLGSRVDMRDGRCAGRIIGQTCSGERKVEFARDFFHHHAPDISLDTCAAYADSRADIPLLTAVRYPVAVYPDHEMRAAALERGWPIYP